MLALQSRCSRSITSFCPISFQFRWFTPKITMNNHFFTVIWNSDINWNAPSAFVEFTSIEKSSPEYACSSNIVNAFQIKFTLRYIASFVNEMYTNGLLIQVIREILGPTEKSCTLDTENTSDGLPITASDIIYPSQKQGAEILPNADFTPNCDYSLFG